MKLFSSIIFSLVLILGVGFSIQQVNAQVATCSTTTGYNTATGASCNGATIIPLGCSSTAGFSSSTGMPCNGNTAAVNGYDGTMVDSNGYLSGCTSTSGYSATTGSACNMPINGVIYTGNGTTVNVGLPTTTTTTVDTTDPGLPTTGDGSNTLINLAILLGAATVAIVGAREIYRYATAQ